MASYRVPVAVTLASLLLAGCVTSQTTSFKAASGQTALVRDGRAALQSARAKTMIVASPVARETPLGARSSIVLGIRNLSKEAVTFRLADVVATQVGGPADGRELKVFSYDELVSEEKNRQIAAAILVGVAAGANAYGAARSSHNPYIRTWNQHVATQQNAELIAQTAAQGEINLAALETSIIKDNTLLPGETYGGVLVVSPPTTAETAAPSAYRLSIALGSDRHEIEVNQTPIQR